MDAAIHLGLIARKIARRIGDLIVYGVEEELGFRLLKRQTDVARHGKRAAQSDLTRAGRHQPDRNGREGRFARARSPRQQNDLPHMHAQ